MTKLLPSLDKYWKTVVKAAADNRAATAIEYGLIMAFVVIGMMVGLNALGMSTTRMWNGIDGKVGNAINQ